MTDRTATVARTILLGYVPTPEGAAALAFATAEALQHQAHLVVLNTGNEGDYDDPVFASEADIDAVSAELTRVGVAHTVRRPANDLSVAETILDAADELEAGLIVIGIRRRSPVGKLVTGSDTQRILLAATCPVAAVKPRPRPRARTS